MDALNAAGMYVIIDMHWSSTGQRQKAVGQLPMPDERYAPAFWTSVANAFKGNPAVIFDLYNEPYPNRNTDSAASWKCDLDGSAGGTCTGFRFRAAGMQQLLDAVRAHGGDQRVDGRGAAVRRGPRPLAPVRARGPDRPAGGQHPHLLEHPGPTRTTRPATSSIVLEHVAGAAVDEGARSWWANSASSTAATRCTRRS